MSDRITRADQQERSERFLALLEPLHDNLARFARSLVGSDEEGRDLVAETILHAFEKFDQLKDEKAFMSWLFTTALRLHRRRRKRGEAFGIYDEEVIAQRHSPESPPDLQHDLTLLQRSIDRLKEKEREAILLFEIAGLSLEEIREIQGGSLSGVKSRLTRGREKLKLMLGVGKKVEEEGKERPERQRTGDRQDRHDIGTESLPYIRLPDRV